MYNIIYSNYLYSLVKVHEFKFLFVKFNYYEYIYTSGNYNSVEEEYAKL